MPEEAEPERTKWDDLIDLFDRELKAEVEAVGRFADSLSKDDFLRFLGNGADELERDNGTA